MIVVLAVVLAAYPPTGVLLSRRRVGIFATGLLDKVELPVLFAGFVPFPAVGGFPKGWKPVPCGGLELSVVRCGERMKKYQQANMAIIRIIMIPIMYFSFFIGGR